MKVTTAILDSVPIVVVGCAVDYPGVIRIVDVKAVWGYIVSIIVVGIILMVIVRGCDYGRTSASSCSSLRIVYPIVREVAVIAVLEVDVPT